MGGENDSPSRQLARFVKEVGENGATGMRVNIIYRRDRYLGAGAHALLRALGVAVGEVAAGKAVAPADRGHAAPADGRE